MLLPSFQQPALKLMAESGDGELLQLTLDQVNGMTTVSTTRSIQDVDAAVFGSHPKLIVVHTHVVEQGVYSMCGHYLRSISTTTEQKFQPIKRSLREMFHFHGWSNPLFRITVHHTPQTRSHKEEECPRLPCASFMHLTPLHSFSVLDKQLISATSAGHSAVSWSDKQLSPSGPNSDPPFVTRYGNLLWLKWNRTCAPGSVHIWRARACARRAEWRRGRGETVFHTKAFQFPNRLGAYDQIIQKCVPTATQPNK